ncbi:MAG TPA: hypothetical protein VML55_09330 [Planctomycetaceae bacterium]|nr:hypothetical protein [Planctomycetaceae bacterium]
MQTLDDLIASRREWIERVLKPWCRAAALNDLREAEADWQNLAGGVDPAATLWAWAWARFPALVHGELAAVDESREIRVTLRDGRVVTGYPDARQSQRGRLVVVAPRAGSRGFDEHGPFAIDDIVSITTP